MTALRRYAALAMAWGVLAHAGAGRAVEPADVDPDDGFVLGYVTALLATEFGLEAQTLDLSDSELRVVLLDAPKRELDKVARALLLAPGVDSVRIEETGVPEPLLVASDEHGAATPPQPAVLPEPSFVLFPRGELFEPLLADPRWPRFSVSHLWALDDPELGRVGAANFGETFAFLRREGREYGRYGRYDWEVGLQAGVFSIFDLDAESLDLINSDFLVAFFFSQRLGPASLILRFAHQSSHLGDEFLLRTRVDRVNLSFETLDAVLSLDATKWLRVYAGGGLLVHREPRLDRGLAQTGIALESPRAVLGGRLRPLAEFDLQFRDESSWRPDISLRWGVQLEHPQLRRMRLQMLVEYYRGRSPNGQFFTERLQTIGLGLHLGF